MKEEKNNSVKADVTSSAVFNDDCLKVMSSISNKFFDVAITDPPYGLENDFDFVREAIKEMQRISKMQIIILDWRNPLTIADEKFAELIWEYGWISGGRTKSNHFYPTHNTIHFCGLNKFRFDTKNGTIIKRQAGFSSPRQCSYAKKSGHPYEKPLKLMEYLIERSDCENIIDPFKGSGTTCLAAKNLGKKIYWN
jgi:site-specific DNA-methyltransferase (adenine-specific)